MRVFRLIAAMPVACLVCCASVNPDDVPKSVPPTIPSASPANTLPSSTLSTTNASPLAGFHAWGYHLESFVPESGANISGGGSVDGTPIIQYPFGGGSNEFWSFHATASDSNLYSIVNPNSTKCIGVANQSTSVGAAIVLQACSAADPGQQWLAVQNANAFTFVNAGSHLCLSVQNDSKANGAPLVQAACGADPGQEWQIAAPTLVTGYGFALFLASPQNAITTVTVDMVVPAEPPPSGTLFLWPGLQPQSQSSSFEPVELGVLQPVLTWGASCAPTTQPTPFSTWWISGQYVGGSKATGRGGCYSGDAMSVAVADTLHIVMATDGNDWTQSVLDKTTGQSVTFTNSLGGQAQTELLFDIEEYSSTPVSDIIFQNLSFTVANPDPMFCTLSKLGTDDYAAATQVSSDMRTCTMSKLILRAQGVAATTPNP